MFLIYKESDPQCLSLNAITFRACEATPSNSVDSDCDNVDDTSFQRVS